MSRVNGKILFVGSIPFQTAEEVFCTTAQAVGDQVSCLPDGEIGFRKQWINFLAAKLYCEHPSLTTVSRPKTPDGGDGWEPTGYDEHWFFRVRDGVESIRFDDLGYAREANDSYAVFRRLRNDGVIPRGVRFQISLPLTESATRPFVISTKDFQIMWAAYEDAMMRELALIVKAIPAEDLVIQWDIFGEVVAIATGDQREGLSAWEAPGDPFDRYLGALQTLARHVPDAVPMGLHLCYGDLLHRHLVEPQDLGVVVRVANESVDAIKRPVDYVHMPVPRSRYDRSYFAPLQDLSIGDARLYLGLVHHTNGLDGTLRRIDAAKRQRSSFGIATECGLGRRKPETIPELLKIHRAAATQLD
ncbi:MAG: hypothetical protein AB7V27_10495 [Candidatus Binatia bacterium]